MVNLDHGYVHRPEDFEFVPGIFELVARANELGYAVVIVTNQAGIGRGYYTEQDFLALMNWVGQQFEARGARIDKVYFCPFHAEHGVGDYRRASDRRKPEPGMLLDAARDLALDIAGSIMLGDRPSDMEAARRAGVRTRWLLADETPPDGCVRMASLFAALQALDHHASCR